MTVRIKICGINSVEAASAAVAAAADFGGLVFFPASPRHLSFDQARHLAGILRGSVRVVSLLVNPDDALVQQVVTQVAPDLIQLHGDESPARVSAIAHMSQRPVIKALAVTTPEDLSRIAPCEEVADYLLFDSRPGPAAERPGGAGVAFDWRLLRQIRIGRPWGLAGGLTPDNVARAIAIATPAFVDASSGVEDAPGRKSRDKITAFITAVRGASIVPENAEPLH